MSVNHIFRHYKGNYYKVLYVGLHTETKESMIVYQQLYFNEYPNGTVWIRPYDMFLENVVVNNVEVPRFTICPHIE